MAYVYRHIRKDTNQVFYIGIGTRSGLHRAKSKSCRNKIWNSIVSKTEYEVEILFEDVSWDFAVEKEIEFIKLYGKIIDKNGTLSNLTDGGEGCAGFSHSEETKIRLSKSKKGEKNPMYGTVSPNKGKKTSEEVREKIRLSNTGKFKGEKNPYYGKKHSDEIRKKMSDIQKTISKKGEDNPMSRKIINSNNGKVYDCIREAAEDFGFTYSKVKCLLNGKTKVNNTGLEYL
jgi:hypothetical protein